MHSFVTRLLLLAMAMGVNYDENKQDKSARKHHDEHRLVLPNRGN